MWQEQLGTGLSNNPYTLSYSANGQGIAVRNGSFNLGGGTVTYLHSDNLGSASAVSNASGAIINTATYDPWGQVVEGGVPQTDKGYTGQQRDDTGLMWYQSRLYDPNLGRFLSADTTVTGSSELTIWPSDSTASSSWAQAQEGGTAFPQGLNRYSYVDNNPLRNVDPTGHTTYSVGLTLRANLFYGGTLNIGYTWDDKGNGDFYAAKTYGGSLGGNLSISVGSGFTVLDTIYDTGGKGLQIGTSGGVLGNTSLDVPISNDTKAGNPPLGLNVSFGAGIGVEGHIEETYTTVPYRLPKPKGVDPCITKAGKCGDSGVPTKTPAPNPKTKAKPTVRGTPVAGEQ